VKDRTKEAQPSPVPETAQQGGEIRDRWAWVELCPPTVVLPWRCMTGDDRPAHRESVKERLPFPLRADCTQEIFSLRDSEVEFEDDVS
jgi:hypothetical protein